MVFENNAYKNNDFLENLGYTYHEWNEEYHKVMSSGLSTGHISDWGGWHYYLELDIEGRDIRDETMAKLNADFKELKDDFNAFINYLKEVYLKQDPSLEFYLDESSNKIKIRRRQN